MTRTYQEILKSYIHGHLSEVFVAGPFGCLIRRACLVLYTDVGRLARWWCSALYRMWKGNILKTPTCVLAIKMYSWCCLDSGDTEHALKLSEEVLSMRTAALPPDDPQLAMGGNECYSTVKHLFIRDDFSFDGSC